MLIWDLQSVMKLTPPEESCSSFITAIWPTVGCTQQGLITSLVLPVGACLIHKIALIDVAVWGTVSLFLQLFLFRVTDAIFRGMPERISNNEVPAAMVLASFKLAGSITLAIAIVG